jgi:transcription elongation factor GreA
MYKITEKGKMDLEAELADLRTQYEAVVEQVAEAREQGDLSENAEYANARDEQGRIQTRIDEVEKILKNAKLIADAGHSEVELGAHVVLSDKSEYEVVGSLEADPLNGKISDESPIGAALKGKKVGDEVEIKTPKGAKKVTIKKIA